MHPHELIDKEDPRCLYCNSEVDAGFSSEWMPGGVKTVGEQTFKGLKEVSVSITFIYLSCSKLSPAYSFQTTTDVGVFDQCLVATTTVSFSMQTGSTVASSVIESYPGGSSTSSSDATHNITVIRRHDLKRQVVVSQAETCYPCGQRYIFILFQFLFREC